MKYRYIGNTGLRVSSIAMGTMTFGSVCDKKEAFLIMDEAYEKGINFFDTAEMYPVPQSQKTFGDTEIIVGEWLKTKKRDSIILASKVTGAANHWFVPPVRHGLTALDKFHIKKAIDGSLKRLKTDYIDLYQTHWQDNTVLIDETLEVLGELIKEGKVRYIGTSNANAYELTKANEVAKFKNLKRYESIQNNFSLINPRFFDELELVCKKENISLLAYSPLGGGILTGKYNQEVPVKSRFGDYLNNKNPRSKIVANRFLNQKTLKATKEYTSLADEYGLNVATMSIMYAKHFKFVASAIIGARSKAQLELSLDAIDKNLDEEILIKIKKIQKKILYPMG